MVHPFRYKYWKRRNWRVFYGVERKHQ